MTDFPPADEPLDEPHDEAQPYASPQDDVADAPPEADLAAPPGPVHPGYVQPVQPRRLFRSRHDRKVGGVSAGIAEYFNIDPTIVRLATLVAALTGVGFLAYLAAWLIVPIRPEGQFPDGPSTFPLPSERTMTVAFGIAALALAFGIVTDSWEVLALALIGGGIWLLSEQTRVAQPMAPAAAPPGTYAPPAPAGSGTAGFAGAAFAPTASEPMQNDRWQQSIPAPPDWSVSAPPKEHKPQRVTWLVLSLLALLAAVGIAASTGNWWDVSATRFLGIGVITIGVGVVVGQVRGGGARGLIPLGILAALALFPVSAVDGLLDDGVGQSVYRPLTIEDLQPSYQHGIGELTVDLTELDLTGRSETIDIDLGIGELIVIVSDEVGGKVVLQAKAGEISHQLPQTDSFLFEDGVNIESGLVRLQGEDGQLDLNISVGLGTAELRSEAN